MENEKICKNCAHYRRHYILDKQRCTPVNCGHCIYPRIKKREPNRAACEYFEYRDNRVDLPDREEVVSFLTTDFLKEVLRMALPPMVEEDEGFD